MADSARSQEKNLAKAHRFHPLHWGVFTEESDSTTAAVWQPDGLQSLSILENHRAEPGWQHWIERLILRAHLPAPLEVDDAATSADPKAFLKAWIEFTEGGTSAERNPKTQLEARLEEAQRSYPAMSAQFADAVGFAAAFDDRLLQPSIWTDGEAEVVLEWILPDGRHAVVSFEGDGEFGYALRTGGRFVPGLCSGTKPFRVPFDLVRYLSMK